ncbi:MAG: hypothetical protein JEZ02_10600 [Desulfatibacillum sp.]|nr:hypothetical protein [Desulfatibacillum sp.]
MHRWTESGTLRWIAASTVCGLAFATALAFQMHALAGCLGVLGILAGGMALNSKPSAAGEIKRFGLIALVVFGCLFALATWRGREFLTGFFAVFAIAGGLCAAAPQPMAPLQAAWTAAAKAFGAGINAFFLILAWFLVITPLAWLKRLVSGRPLPLHPDKNAQTYWVNRKEPVQPRERFGKRY